MDHTADLELVGRMLAGEERAFETFGERYFKALYRFTSARLQGDRDLTREIVQIAMMKALSKLDSYRGEASLLTWLCSCCRNEILMHLRRRRTAPVNVEPVELEKEVEPSDDPEVALLGRERALRVHMALDGIPEHYARALEWKYLDRLPVREVASRMGVLPKAAESILTRARQAFRKTYESFHGRME